MYYDVVECPYCGYENDMSDGCVDLPDDNKFDHDCEYCGKDFEVEIEFEPNYLANRIVYETCECCGNKTRDFKKKGRVYPFPKDIKESLLCSQCWKKALYEEICNE